MNTHNKDYLSWCLDKKLDPNSQAVFESYVFRTVTSHETMMEQIKRLNAEEKIKHEQRKQEVINKIRLLRRAQREQQELNHK
jgi:hypothetical protein